MQTETVSNIHEMTVIACSLILVIGVGGCSFVVWCFMRSKAILKAWARGNGFEILRSKSVAFPTGLRHGIFDPVETVYEVQVRDREGHERRGRLHCGPFLTGIFHRGDATWEADEH